MNPGDHLVVKRVGYSHHGIYCGRGLVIHYVGAASEKDRCLVRRTTLKRFAGGGHLRTVAYRESDTPEIVIRRAESRLGQAGYSLIFNNCEHFARWCKTGLAVSDQVRTAASALGIGAGTSAGVAGGITTVGALGAAAGLSGPGVMSGLATVGGAFGGGAAAGVAGLAAAPATAATALMLHAMKDDPRLGQGERTARKAARAATVAGALGGTVGAVQAVAASGAVAGLSGAGITSGLAAIGGTLGGGMVAGVAVTTAAPALAAVALCFGAYKLVKWICD